jgi:hypothetical protein
MAILDSKGQVIDSMNGYFAPDLMQRLLQNHADNPADVSLVSTPVVDSRTKKWQIQISRRLNHPTAASPA